MIKLKIDKIKLNVIASFCDYTSVHIGKEIDKYFYRKKTFDLIQLKIQLEEMRILKRKIDIFKIRKMDKENNKIFSFSLSPIQLLLILTYVETYIKSTEDAYCLFVLNEQKDFLYHELLTNYN